MKNTFTHNFATYRAMYYKIREIDNEREEKKRVREREREREEERDEATFLIPCGEFRTGGNERRKSVVLLATL